MLSCWRPGQVLGSATRMPQISGRHGICNTLLWLLERASAQAAGAGAERTVLCVAAITRITPTRNCSFCLFDPFTCMPFARTGEGLGMRKWETLVENTKCSLWALIKIWDWIPDYPATLSGTDKEDGWRLDEWIIISLLCGLHKLNSASPQLLFKNQR